MAEPTITFFRSQYRRPRQLPQWIVQAGVSQLEIAEALSGRVRVVSALNDIVVVLENGEQHIVCDDECACRSRALHPTVKCRHILAAEIHRNSMQWGSDESEDDDGPNVVEPPDDADANEPQPENTRNDERCAICYEDLTTGGAQYKCDRCDHLLHLRCADRWFRTKSSCPFCRQEID